MDELTPEEFENIFRKMIESFDGNIDEFKIVMYGEFSLPDTEPFMVQIPEEITLN